MTYTITEVASEIHKELEDPTSPTEQEIFFWISYNAGRLNNLISTFFKLEGDDYSPQLETDEKDILKALYYEYYYNRAAKRSLIGSQDSILSLRDDVSSVSFTNPKEVAKVYKEMAKEESTKASVLANLYKHNRSGPRDPRNRHDGHWE